MARFDGRQRFKPRWRSFHFRILDLPGFLFSVLGGLRLGLRGFFGLGLGVEFAVYDVVGQIQQEDERVAFNEGYQAQKIASAKQAGRDAFNLGLDSGQGKDLYFASVDRRFMEAKEFLSGESAVQIESIEPDQIGDITDGEETLGMESAVANETDDDDYDPMLDAAGAYDLADLPPSPHQDEFHQYLHETRDIGESFVGYHEWHMDNYGDFGIR